MTIARIEDVAALAQAFGADIKALDTDVEAIAPNVRKLNTEATRAPLPSDDETQGYEVGSRWLWQGQEWLYVGPGRWLLLTQITPEMPSPRGALPLPGRFYFRFSANGNLDVENL